MAALPRNAKLPHASWATGLMYRGMRTAGTEVVGAQPGRQLIARAQHRHKPITGSWSRDVEETTIIWSVDESEDRMHKGRREWKAVFSLRFAMVAQMNIIEPAPYSTEPCA